MQAVPDEHVTATVSPELWIKPRAKNAALLSSTTIYNWKKLSCSNERTILLWRLPGDTTILRTPNCFSNEINCSTIFSFAYIKLFAIYI